ncbi:CAP domain-containing protein [Blastococcus capsensis]|uniref:CAP domain-containing protein n=1 Tax=Blastococcus capsensis TaxID=1564163 RepID=UPI002540EC5B|nr:CAP domain-containing protein [Blastococcus capsensis]MDK3256207.1 CAP domain-containing protein [Blastococcus capsensis]
MRHRPSAPPRPHRPSVRTPRPGRSRSGRLYSLAGRLSRVLVATAAVTATLLVVPVLPGPAESPTVGLDASSRSGAAGSQESSTSAFPGTSPAPVATGGAPAGPAVAAPSPPPIDTLPAAPPSTAPPSTATPTTGTPTADVAAETPTADVAAETPTADVAAGAPVPVPAPTPPPAPPAGAAPRATVAAAQPAGSPGEAQVLALVNAERGRAGCGPLTADPGLAAVARAHSTDMRDRGFFDHVNLDGLDPFDRADRAGVAARAENIARGQADAAAVMTSWMNSPGHRQNILDCSLTRLGVGIAAGPGGPWWTQLFG